MIKEIDTIKNKEKIISLWSECFGDSDEYTSFFLDNCPNECLGIIENNELVSMLFLLDGKIDSFKIKYVYAACTKESFRGRGFMSQLMEYTVSYCRQLLCDGIFLVPAEDSLYSFYNRFGFECCFERFQISADFDLKSLNSTEVTDVENAAEIRKELLKNIDSFIFDDNILEYSVKEHIFDGGKILYCNNDNVKSLIFLKKTGNNYIITELLSDNPVKMLKNFKHFTNNDTENIYIYCPIVYNNKDLMVKCTKCGMLFCLTDELKKSSVGKSFYAGIYLD